MVASQRWQDSSDTMHRGWSTKSEMEDTTTRECYGSNSSAYITCQQTHVIYDGSNSSAYVTCQQTHVIYDTRKIYDTHKGSATEHWLSWTFYNSVWRISSFLFWIHGFTAISRPLLLILLYVIYLLYCCNTVHGWVNRFVGVTVVLRSVVLL